MLGERSPMEGHSVCDSISQKRPKQANPRDRRKMTGCQGLRGGGCNGQCLEWWGSPLGVTEMFWSGQVKVVDA